MQIIRSKPEDAPVLTHIAFAAKRHWGYPENWIQSWSALLTIEPNYIEADSTCHATIDGQIVGFHSVKQEPNKIHLEHLWVLPAMMGKGIGRALFADAIERAQAARFASLYIESDPNAAGFYERMGARCVGSRVAETEGHLRELPLFVYEISNRK